MQLTRRGGRALVLDPVEQELAHERVMSETALRVLERPQRQPAACGLLGEIGRQAEGVEAGLVELGGHARVDQRLA